MKAANPAIQVCATDTGTSFIDDAGTSLPYDCLQDHPYVGAGAISASLPIDQYEADVMAVPDAEYASVQSFQAQVDQAAGRHVPLVLTEYGQLINSTPDPLQAPYYLNSLDEALINASQLADWIKLGIPVADRQLLTAELPDPSAVTAGLPGAAPFATTGAITTSGGSQTVVQPTGAYLALMEPLAGGSQLPTTVIGDPAIAGANPATGDLSAVSSATPLRGAARRHQSQPERRRRLRGELRRGDERDGRSDHARRSVAAQRQHKSGAGHRIDQRLNGGRRQRRRDHHLPGSLNLARHPARVLIARTSSARSLPSATTRSRPPGEPAPGSMCSAARPSECHRGGGCQKAVGQTGRRRGPRGPRWWSPQTGARIIAFERRRKTARFPRQRKPSEAPAARRDGAASSWIRKSVTVNSAELVRRRGCDDPVVCRRK